jgi:CRP/FNR family transcriptional regulator
MLAGIAMPKHLKKGERLFLEGEKGHAVYLCGTGSIQLTKEGAEAKDVVVKVIGPGELFGEVVLFEKDRFPVSATALKNSTVFVLPKHQFHCLLENKSFRDDFIVLLMHKQRYLTSRLRDLQSHDVEERFFRFLKDQYGPAGKISPGISKKDMAAAIGTVPETFSRLLQRLKKQGVARWEKGEIVLRDGFWKSNSKD